MNEKQEALEKLKRNLTTLKEALSVIENIDSLFGDTTTDFQEQFSEYLEECGYVRLGIFIEDFNDEYIKAKNGLEELVMLYEQLTNLMGKFEPNQESE